MKLICINIIQGVHYAAIVFLVFGWLVPNHFWLKVHAVSIPLVVAHWKLNRDTCVLTNLEAILRGEPPYPENGEGQFVAGLLEAWFAWRPSRSMLAWVVYGPLGLALLISLARLSYLAG